MRNQSQPSAEKVCPGRIVVEGIAAVGGGVAGAAPLEQLLERLAH